MSVIHGMSWEELIEYMGDKIVVNPVDRSTFRIKDTQYEFHKDGGLSIVFDSEQCGDISIVENNPYFDPSVMLDWIKIYLTY